MNDTWVEKLETKTKNGLLIYSSVEIKSVRIHVAVLN